MGKRVNFCKDCKFCSHHKQEITGWGYYCTNPKATLYNFVDGNISYVSCGAVRGLDTDRLAEFWREFTGEVKKGDITKEKIDKLTVIYEDSNKKFQYCPLYRKKLTLRRFWKLKFIKLIRYVKRLLW